MRYRVYSIGKLPTLKIHLIGYSSDISGTTFIARKNETHLIGYVLSGSGTYNGYPISAGQGFLFTPNVAETFYPDVSNPPELLWFTGTDPELKELLPCYRADSKTKIFIHTSPAELQYIKDFVIAENRATISDGRMLELFFSVFKHHLNEQTPATPTTTAAQSYIDFSVNYIQTHYNQNVTVSHLTKLLGVSQPYLYRIFKEAFGKSPKAFICEYRMKMACKFLTETDMPVSEVASSVGYSDSFAFSKAFSALQSISPSEYRLLTKTTASVLNK